MNIQFLSRLAGGCLALVLTTSAAVAQSNRELAERVNRLEQAVQSMTKSPEATAAEDADLALRILKLEQLVEQLTGQIEETRFRANQTARQVEQLSNDLNLRVATLEQAAKLPPGAAMAAAQPGATMSGSMPGSAAASLPGARPISPSAPAAAQAAVAGSSAVASDSPLSRPMTPQPVPAQQAPNVAAPLAQAAATPQPQIQGQSGAGGFGQLRTDAQGRPLPPDPNQPLAPVVDNTPPPPAPVPMRAPTTGAVASSQLGVEAGIPVDVALPEGTPKQQYDYAFDFLKRQDYPRAEAAFREFMKRYPKDALAGNAQYWLGETYYVRNDLQKSVIEFMNGYQNYPKSNKAPDNLLKLGMSLSRLGQSKEACTALGRLSKEYPDAGDQIRRSAQQERQRLKCAA
ncbi:MAG: tol-pal system protein YbgF [Alphaproteobacteria bacterium]|nr:tol-pal system protein YbgF [Alphaproteobacteria bacterium]